MDGLVNLHQQWPMLSSIIEQIPIQKLALIEYLCLLINESDDQAYINISQLLRNHYQFDIDHHTLRLLSTIFGTTIPNFHTPGNHTRTTAEFDSVIIGCDKSPKPGEDYCDEHKHRHDIPIENDDEEDVDNGSFIKLRNGKQVIRYQSLTCNTTKSFPMKYVSVCHRSFGIIVYFTNCGVCLAINEIYRSETVKEILMGWFDIISATSTNVMSALPDELANTPLPRVVFIELVDKLPIRYRQVTLAKP
ncbi:unnamed protein product [Rotaria sordida]|uniref:Uncharacterized protein n=1 Tax=Rotaria sordida TaxID=392033 RepID=A0A819LE56_9BILA|nr:unnamed protein product [Rotaria sordida]